MNMPHLSRLAKELTYLDREEQVWLMEELTRLLRQTAERTRKIGSLAAEAQLNPEAAGPGEDSLSDQIDALYDQLAELTARVTAEPELTAKIRE